MINDDIDPGFYRPFVPDIDEIESNAKSAKYIHIRVKQRTNRTKITLIEGLDEELDHPRLCRQMQKEMNCGGGKVTQTDHGTVIQLAGDQREKITEFLLREGLVEKKSQIKTHGV